MVACDNEAEGRGRSGESSVDGGEGAFVGGCIGNDVHVERDTEVGDVVVLVGSYHEYEFGADLFEGVGDACEHEFSADVG